MWVAAGIASLICVLVFVFGVMGMLLISLWLGGLYRALLRLAGVTRALWSPDRKTRRAARRNFATLGRVSLVAVSVAAVVYGLWTR